MSSNKPKASGTVNPARREETYEAAAFATKYGVPPSEAATIIKRYGPSRKKLDAYMAARQA